MIYYGTHLSENISRREPEGYLLCLNVPVARSGTQEYLPEELGCQKRSLTSDANDHNIDAVFHLCSSFPFNAPNLHSSLHTPQPTQRV